MRVLLTLIVVFCMCSIGNINAECAFTEPPPLRIEDKSTDINVKGNVNAHIELSAQACPEEDTKIDTEARKNSINSHITKTVEWSPQNAKSSVSFNFTTHKDIHNSAISESRTYINYSTGTYETYEHYRVDGGMSNDKVNVIVQLEDAPIAAYENNIEMQMDLQATFGVNSVDAYAAQLSKLRGAVYKKFEQNNIDAIIRKEFGLLFNGFSATVTRADIHKIRALPEVKTVYLDRVYRLPYVEAVTPADNYTVCLETSVTTIRAPTAWAFGYNGSGVKVALIDTGINKYHPDLVGKIILEWDFCNNDADASDDHGHGTHCAGIIAANGNILGVAPGASLLSAKAFGEDGTGSESDILAALEWAISNGADVISCSFGIPTSSYTINDGMFFPLSQAMGIAAERVVVVVACGNEGPATGGISSPADAYNVITVGASNDHNTINLADDSIAYFSNRGPSAFGRLDPDVVAPGVNINSTWLFGYAIKSGTSMATPHVAGAAALILQAEPSLTPGEVRLRLMNTATIVSSNVFEQGAGLINVGAALTNTIFATIKSQDRLDEFLCNQNESYIIPVAIQNTASSPAILNFSVTDLRDGEANHIFSGANFVVPQDIEIAGGCIQNVSVGVAIPSMTSPGIYGGFLLIASSSTSIQVKLPLVISIAATDCTITGTVDNSEDMSWPPDFVGDCILYPLNIPHNVISFTVHLNWTNSTNDLDLFLFGLMGDYSYFIDSSGKWTGTNESVYWYNPIAGLGTYWVMIYTYNLNTQSTTYYLTINFEYSLTVTPTHWLGAVAQNSTVALTFTVTNKAEFLSINMSIKSYGLQAYYNTTHIVPETGPAIEPPAGTAHVYYLSSYNSILGLNLVDMNTKIINVYLNWTNISNDLSLELNGWQDLDDDKILDPGETTTIWYMDYPNSTSEAIVNFGVWYVMIVSELSVIGEARPIDDLLLFVCGDDVPDSNDTYNLTITTFADLNCTWASATPASVALETNESCELTVQINTTGVELGEYTGYLSIDDSDTNYAEVPLSISVRELANISITPQFTTLLIGETCQFTAVSYDNEGNSILISPRWKVTGGGIIDTQGYFTATEKGIWTIYANQSGLSGVATILVTYDNEPWVYDIPDISFDEDTIYESLDLDDYVLDPNHGLTELSWSCYGNCTIEVSIDALTHIVTLTPPTNWSGSETITFIVSDPNGLCDYDYSIVTVTAANDPPVVSDIPDIVFTEDSPDTIIDLDDYVYDSDNLASELTWSYSGATNILVDINATTHLVTFTATPDWTGTELIIFTATDLNGATDSDEVIVTVTGVNDAPLVEDIPNISFDEDTIYNSLDLDNYVTDVDNPDSELIWSCAGNTYITVSIDALTHIVTLSTPTNWYGSELITITVTDPDGATDSDYTIVTVNPINDVPVLSDIQNISFNEDDTYSFDLDDYVTDVDNSYSEIAWSYSGNINITVSIDPSTHIVTFGALANWFGSEIITFTAIDTSLAADSDTLIVTVHSVNDAPVLADIPAIYFDEDSSYAFDLDEYVVDVDNLDAELTWNFTGNVYISISIEILTHIATLTAPPNWFGTETIGFIVADPEGLNDTETVSITVNSINDAPIILDIPTIMFAEDMSYSFDLDDYVYDVDNLHSELIWTYFGNTNLIITIDAITHLATFTTVPNWYGVETITFVVTDPDLEQASISTTVTVLPVNDAPMISDIPSIAFDEDTTYNLLDLDAYVTDADDPDAAIMWTVIGNVYLTVIIDPITHRVTFTPPVNWSGSETIIFVATDHEGATATAIISATVVPINDAPTISPIPPQLGIEDVPWSLDIASWIYDVDNDIENLFIDVNDSTYVTVNGSVLTFLYPNGITYDEVNISVSDGELSANYTIVVIIAPVNDPPLIKDVPDQLGHYEDEPWSVDVSLYINDPDNPIHELILTVDSNYATVIGHVITFCYPNGITFEHVTITVCDGTLFAAQTINVTIIPVNDPPVIDTIPTIFAIEDVEGYFDLSPYIYDIDNDRSELTLTVVSQYVAVTDDLELVFTFPEGIISATVELTVSDGVNSTCQLVAFAIKPVNDPPFATIYLPKNGNFFLQNAPVIFDGAGIDPEDGNLIATSLVWRSNIDGILGVGNMLTTTNLSAGLHIISLTATDSSGASTTVYVNIEILPDFDLDGLPDDEDDDIDGDGYPNARDVFLYDSTEWSDTDNDGIGDNRDEDDDNDGYADCIDVFAWDPSEWFDTDADGIGNNRDEDDDNDGIPDEHDPYPDDATKPEVVFKKVREKEAELPASLYWILTIIGILIILIFTVVLRKKKLGEELQIKESKEAPASRIREPIEELAECEACHTIIPLSADTCPECNVNFVGIQSKLPLDMEPTREE